MAGSLAVSKTGNFDRSHAMHVLLVEDNEGDIECIREGFCQSGVTTHLHVVHTGSEALEFLRQLGPYSQHMQPDVIMLDLSIPEKSGVEVLIAIKQDPALKNIPVIIFSGSNSAKDMEASYHLNADAYMTKPSDLKQFMQVAKVVQAFCFHTIRHSSA